MKVYVVSHLPLHANSETIGVFDSREAAWEGCSKRGP